MRRTREILRQKWLLGRSHRAVAQSLGLSVGKVSTTLTRVQAAGLSWSEVEGLVEAELEVRLYGAQADEVPRRARVGAWLRGCASSACARSPASSMATACTSSATADAYRSDC